MKRTGETGLTQRICDAVAAEADTDVLELPPLYGAIDPDALDAVLDGPDGTDPSRVVEFAYGGYLVAVDATGGVRLRPDTGTTTD